MKTLPIHRYLILLTLLALLPAINLMAGDVSGNQALTRAERIVRQYFPLRLQAVALPVVINREASANEPFYVCQTGRKGFVLVSKNDQTPPILGFSWESNYPSASDRMPEMMSRLIFGLRNSCSSPSGEQIPGDLSRMEKTGTMGGTQIIAPLLKTTWNNDTTFFDLFPGSSRTGGSTPIAMGQVFRFYEKPLNGTGEFCYNLNGYGELCAEFNITEFAFDRMSNTVGNPAVDSLMYFLSIACSMQPGGASLSSFATTLPVHFGYSPEMRSVDSWEYDLREVILHQLSLRRPVPAEWIGHSFVIDGYFPDNLFHFNMGWGGEYNGFYLIDYPVTKVDTDHALLTCHINYHPKSLLPVPTGIAAVTAGDSLRLSWTGNLNDSLQALLVRYVVLRDGVIPVAQSTTSSVTVAPAQIGGSAFLRVMADFGEHGSSELSQPYRYITNFQVADIPSLNLRQKINTALGNTDLLRQPFVGELELINDIEINFPDQRGLELLTKLRSLRVDGANFRFLRDGDYLQNITSLHFYNCLEFEFGIFNHTRSIQQLYGYDFTPFDLYDFRHNADVGLFQFVSTDKNPNMLMDLYGADKYFPKLADFYLYHLAGGAGGTFVDCFVSFESYYAVYPKIRSSLNLYTRTKPTPYAPCYPSPAREANVPGTTRISWQSNPNNDAGVFYNVFVGPDRSHLELVSIFQMDKYYDGVFEPDKDYYWRVEAYHADSTYYSGIYHFSTWRDLPIPFVDRFDEYYTACPVVEESPFWVNTDNTLTGKAVTNRVTRYDGNYSLELKPRSDAGVRIKTADDPVYHIEFRFLNQGGEMVAELLQGSGNADEPVVNAKIEMTGEDAGLFVFENTSYPFNYLPGAWNRVNFSLNMTTGLASFTLNEMPLKEWQWKVQLGGTANTNPLAGIRFINETAAGGGSAFLDHLIIDVQNPLGIHTDLLAPVSMLYVPESREIVFSGIEPGEINDIALYDIRGSRMMYRTQPDNLVFRVDATLPAGVYLVVLNRREGRPFSGKIAVVE